MIISIRQILLLAAVVIFVLDAIKVWRWGLIPFRWVSPWPSVPSCLYGRPPRRGLLGVLLSPDAHLVPPQEIPLAYTGDPRTTAGYSGCDPG